MYRKVGKRVFDLVVTLLVIIVLFPIWALTMLLLFLANRGEIFFYQERPGRGEKPFTVIKFKTMNDNRDSAGNLLPDVERTTVIGAAVRKLSLDELPQLINVLKGEMSLIGPRPLLFRYLPLYNEEQRRRHEVCPGITGWAQVNGRNSISWQEKFALDVYYVDHLSFRFDLRIIGLTIIKVMKREGINQSAERPMKPFTGN